jgi:hypothetical protein
MILKAEDNECLSSEYLYIRGLKFVPLISVFKREIYGKFLRTPFI